MDGRMDRRCSHTLAVLHLVQMSFLSCLQESNFPHANLCSHGLTLRAVTAVQMLIAETRLVSETQITVTWWCRRLHVRHAGVFCRRLSKELLMNYWRCFLLSIKRAGVEQTPPLLPAKVETDTPWIWNESPHLSNPLKWFLNLRKKPASSLKLHLYTI